MNLYEIENNKKFNLLVDTYRKRFRELFNTDPVIDENDKSAVNRLIRALPNAKASQLTSLITGLFELDDDFVRKSGYKLQFIDSRINAILAREGKEKSNRPLYVVGYSESGFPVCSHNPNALKEEFPFFKPVLWNDWVNQSIDDKFQIPKEKWALAGNDIALWIEKWKRLDEDKNAGFY